MTLSTVSTQPAPVASARDAYREALLELARADRTVICVDSDTGGLEGLFADLPGQYMNVGIAEANLLGICAGMAAAGLRPFAHTLAGFAAARACEQMKIDIAGSNLPVTVVVTHTGLSAGHYGPTHHAVDDIAIVRTMPNMTVLVPADADEARWAAGACYSLPGPAYIRLGRKATPVLGQAPPPEQRPGRARELRAGDDIALIAAGPHPVRMAIEASRALAAMGIEAQVLDMHTIKPLDLTAVLDSARRTRGIVTIEDHLVVGGLGGAVCEATSTDHPCRVRRIGVPDRFNDVVGDELHLLTAAGVTPQRIVDAALDITDRSRDANR